MLFEMVFLNSFLVALIGIGLCIWAKFSNEPWWIHILWCALLIKMLTPPMISVPVLPQLATGPAMGAEFAALGKQVQSIKAESVLVNPSQVRKDLSWDYPGILAILWVSGSTFLVVFLFLEARRFAIKLRSGREADASLRWFVDTLAKEMGFSHGPRTVVVDETISPAIWSWFGPAILILPLGLFTKLNKSELEGIVLHELAHLRRRDHWIRHLEVFSIFLLWWNPVFWWVRNRLRVVEEDCCDAWVNRARPAQARTYGNALIKTLAFVSGTPRAHVVWSTGLGRLKFLERRLVAIMKRKNQVNRNGFWIRWPVMIAALGILAVYPTWGKNQNSPDLDPPEETEKLTQEQERLSEERQKLQAEAESLNRALADNDTRRQKLEMALQEAQEKKAIVELEKQSREMFAEEKMEEAKRLEHMAEARREAFEAKLMSKEVHLEHQAEIRAARERESEFKRQLQEAVRAQEAEDLESIKAEQIELEWEIVREQARSKERQMEMQTDEIHRREAEIAAQEREFLEELESSERERATEKIHMEIQRQVEMAERRHVEAEIESQVRMSLENQEGEERKKAMEMARLKMEYLEQKRLEDELRREQQEAAVQDDLETLCETLVDRLDRLQAIRDAEVEADAQRALDSQIEELKDELEKIRGKISP